MSRGIWFSLGAITGALIAPGLGAVLAVRLHEWNLNRNR